TRVRESKTYTVKNRNEAERTVLIEHPVRHDFKLIDCKPSETASDVYRFEVKVPAGASKPLVVSEEKTFSQQVQISTTGDEQIRFFLSQPATSAKVKEGLQKALEMRLATAKTTRELREQER